MLDFFVEVNHLWAKHKIQGWELKFIYSEKTTNFCKISTVDLSYVTTVKSTLEILQDFVSFSEYMNFTTLFEVIYKKV